MASSKESKKVCLITGVSGTIGYAISKALKSSPTASWHVVIIGRRPPPSDMIGTDVDDAGKPTAYDDFVKAALSDEADVTKVLDDYFSKQVPELNRLDLLVNCAGSGAGGGPIANVSAETFRGVMEINLVAPYILSRYAFGKFQRPSKEDAGGGRIINIGSIAGQSPRADAVPYATSKFALGGLTQALSVDGREHNIAVCQIDPGNVRSSIMSKEEMARREREEGLLDAEDVAKFVVLVSNSPNELNTLHMTVMPTRQPMVGRG